MALAAMFPTCWEKCVSSFTAPANQHNRDAGDRAYGLSSFPERRLQFLTIFRCHSKGNTLSSVILGPWELAWSGVWNLFLPYDNLAQLPHKLTNFNTKSLPAKKNVRNSSTSSSMIAWLFFEFTSKASRIIWSISLGLFLESSMASSRCSIHSFAHWRKTDIDLEMVFWYDCL